MDWCCRYAESIGLLTFNFELFNNLTLLHGKNFARGVPIVPGRIPSIERFPLGVQILRESSTAAQADGLGTEILTYCNPIALHRS